MEVSLFSKESTRLIPIYEANLVRPNPVNDPHFIGWGEPWKPHVFISTGRMDDGEEHCVRIDFDNEKEAEIFLRAGVFKFYNPRNRTFGIVKEE